MNILIDELPTSVELDGVEYKIHSNFRNMIMFELLMKDDELTTSEKYYHGLKLFYPEIPPCVSLAVQFLLFFYRGGKEESSGSQGEESSPDRIYDYEYDAEYIYAAFLDQYGIDLNEIEYLHWWKFRALFHALTDRTLIVKIMGYRGMELDDDLPPKQKEFYESMKKQYQIPISATEQAKEEAIKEALMNGGDISGLI